MSKYDPQHKYIIMLVKGATAVYAARGYNKKNIAAYIEKTRHFHIWNLQWATQVVFFRKQTDNQQAPHPSGTVYTNTTWKCKLIWIMWYFHKATSFI